jgi:uncharacterized protein YndB with AHSA1/START domain
MQNRPTPSVRPAVPEQPVQTLNVLKEVEIDAPIQLVWESILEELGPGGLHAGGTPMPMTLEAWPGGRWFRDLGDNTGHLWGHVQVIKPPTLLELCGPMFMSYPVASHVQYRLTAGGDDKTRLKLTHRAVGLIDPEHAAGVNSGWARVIDGILGVVARRTRERRGNG